MHLNARRRNNIPGLLPICIGMPLRINNGSGSHYKNYGVHTGTLGTVASLQLTDRDAERLKNNTSAEVTLDDLPINIVIEVQGRMTKDFPGLPAGQFPIVPRTTVWNLYNSTDTQVTIHTKGFAVSPYFSSTKKTMQRLWLVKSGAPPMPRTFC